jgi:thiol-disulfide isomerase/thioredoxin
MQPCTLNAPVQRAVTRRYRPAGLIGYVFLLASLITSTAESAGTLEAYTEAGATPELNLADTRGEVHRLEDYRGKVVLVNFWASWCPPCIYEMPELQNLKKHFAGRAFEIITINVGEKKYKVRKFTKLINLELPVLLDTASETYHDWGVKTLPTSFLIDKEGQIQYTVRGNPGWETEETRSVIESMIP